LRLCKAGGPRSPDFGSVLDGVFPMRPNTLNAHLSITEDALRNERIRVADQLELVRKLRKEGGDGSAAMEVLQSMKGALFALERQRQLLLEQLGRFAPAPAPIHLNHRRSR
jgi:hypothetical protein